MHEPTVIPCSNVSINLFTFLHQELKTDSNQNLKPPKNPSFIRNSFKKLETLTIRSLMISTQTLLYNSPSRNPNQSL